MKDVSVIIINYNTLNLTIDCIKSIKNYTKNIEYEIIVVDNNSIDGSKILLPKIFPDIIYIQNNENIGFGAANNIGAKYSNGKYLFLLNSDTELLNNAIKYFFDYYESSNMKLGAIGANLYDQNKKIGNSYGSFPCVKKELTAIILNTLKSYIFYLLCILNLKYKSKKEYNEIEGRVDFVTGADLFISKDNYLSFDESFFLYYEETYMQYVLSSQGKYSYIIKGPQIIHYEGASGNPFRTFQRFGSIPDIYFNLSRILYFYKTGKSRFILFSLKLFTIIYLLNPIIVYKSFLSIKKIKNYFIKIFKL